ncbi:MAG: Ger(x)C family spore germination protein [Mollicutes bacterium]|nr:Ger(x)C family spore germination protein [Mollicutes bacterium]
MIKKIITIIYLLFFSLLLSGCWDYTSLDEITIVSGMAIDQSEDKKGYHVSLEIFDTTESNKEKIKTAIIESNGITLFDAIRNAKKKITNKLYFANIAVIIVSEQVAKEKNIGEIIDWYLRDAEHRETLSFVISKEKTAKDLLNTKSSTNNAIGLLIKEIVTEDQTVTISVIHNEAYKIYNILNQKKESLVLPAFRVTTNNNEKAVEADGLAIFKNGKLIDFIDDDKSKYILFANNKVKGGILTIKKDNNIDNISLEITNSKTKTSFTYKNNQLKFFINIKTNVIVGEYGINDEIPYKQITKLEKIAANKLNKEVTEIIKYVQEKYNSDIFGFSTIIYRKDPKLWKKLKKDWDKIFKNIEVEVKSEVKIINTSYIK